MKKIFFRKIYPYDPTFGGKYSKYKGYSLSTLNRRSPSVKQDLKILLPNNLERIILCSSLKRGVQTAKLITGDNGKIKRTNLLNEIKFDLKRLITEEEFDIEGSNLVRKRFISAFNHDELSENKKMIKKRMDSIIKLINEFENDKSYLIVSHSFFMKLFEIYFFHRNLFEDSQVLKKYFDPTLKTYNFGEGFELNF